MCLCEKTPASTQDNIDSTRRCFCFTHMQEDQCMMSRGMLGKYVTNAFNLINRSNNSPGETTRSLNRPQPACCRTWLFPLQLVVNLMAHVEPDAWGEHAHGELTEMGGACTGVYSPRT